MLSRHVSLDLGIGLLHGHFLYKLFRSHFLFLPLSAVLHILNPHTNELEGYVANLLVKNIGMKSQKS